MASTKDNYKTISKEMQHILDHAEALVDATSGELDDRIKTARAALKERLDLTKSDFGNLEDRLLETVETADKFIHLQPYYAIGGTFITGLFLGWLMSRK